MEAGTLPPPPRKPLRRSREDRLLFGVCGGLARYFGVDPVLVRIGAVLLLVFGGVGVLAYAAAVLLIPDEGHDEALLRAQGPLWARVLGAVLLAAALAVLFGKLLHGAGLPVPLILLGAAILWVGARRRQRADGGDSGGRVGLIAFGAALVLCGTLGALAAGGAIALNAGGVLGALAVIVGLVVAVSSIWGRPTALIAAGVLLLGAGTVVAASDLDLSGGVGRRVYVVTAASTSHYRLGIGSLEVDLRRAQPVGGAASVDAQLGLGRLLIDVPSDRTVTVQGAEFGGDVRRHSGVDVTRTILVVERSGSLRIRAHVGMGAIEVRQLASGPNLTALPVPKVPKVPAIPTVPKPKAQP